MTSFPKKHHRKKGMTRAKTDFSKNLQYSLEEMDADYQAAVEKGDGEQLEWLVKYTANRAMENSNVVDGNGQLIKMYHGTNADFNEFRRDKIGSTGRFEGSGFNFTPYRERAASYGKNVLEGYLDIQNPLSAEKKTMNASQLAKLIMEIDPTGDNIVSNYARDTRDYGSPAFLRREARTAARKILEYSDSDVDIYSEISSADPDAESLIQGFSDMGYDGLIHYDID